MTAFSDRIRETPFGFPGILVAALGFAFFACCACDAGDGGGRNHACLLRL